MSDLTPEAEAYILGIKDAASFVEEIAAADLMAMLPESRRDNKTVERFKSALRKLAQMIRAHADSASATPTNAQ